MKDIKKFIIVAVSIYILIVMINGILSLGRPVPENNAPIQRAVTVKAPQKYLGEIVRKNRVVSGMGFEESVFYAGDEEIAKEKIVNGKVIEFSGHVPDGKVKFIDEYRNTYGEEYYTRDKRNGPAVSYQDKRLVSESNYFLGQLADYKEFYSNGTLRMEQNFEDAIEFPNDPTRETGSGKLYFNDGTLKYEWSFNKGNATNYKKSYNQNGQIILEAYFDKDGYPIHR